MLRYFSTVLICFLSRSTADAELQFANTSADLGKVQAGKRLTHQFWCTNRGTADVHLLDVRGSCGCLNPRIRAKVLSPGKKTCIEMIINPFGQAAGKHCWRAFLRYRVGDEIREKTLEVTAFLITRVTIQPSRITIVVNGPVRQSIRLLDLREKPLRVTRADLDSTWLQVKKISPMRRQADSWVSEMLLENQDTIPTGRHHLNLTIYTDDPLYSNLHFPITVIKQGRSTLQAIPAEVSMRTGKNEPFGSRLVRIRSRKNQKVKINKVWSNHRAVDCRWAEGPGRFATLRLSVDRAKMSGKKISCEVFVHMNDPIDEKLIIPLRCVVE